MIYFDNSATTSPKPIAVRNAVALAMRLAANPGRSGHSLSLAASEKIYKARENIASFFNCDKPENVVFTLNCTTALNTVLSGVLNSGDHVVVSELEHNSVMRVLEYLGDKGISYTAAKVYPCEDDRTVDSFRRAINKKTRMIVCTHASNVWGIRLPVERISALAHEYGLLFTLDCAQSAGVIPIDVSNNSYDYICGAGHKGLYGPMGTGFLLICTDVIPRPLTLGGTGSGSASFLQPSELPDRLESGTQNFSGICGLSAGIDYVKKLTVEKISRHEFGIIRRIYRGLSENPEVELYMPVPTPEFFVPVLSFNIRGRESEVVAEQLNKRNIAVRGGLHCSPAAHRAAGTENTGAVRVSPSVFNTMNDADRLIWAVKNI